MSPSPSFAFLSAGGYPGAETPNGGAAVPETPVRRSPFRGFQEKAQADSDWPSPARSHHPRANHRPGGRGRGLSLARAGPPSCPNLQEPGVGSGGERFCLHRVRPGGALGRGFYRPPSSFHASSGCRSDRLRLGPAGHPIPVPAFPLPRPHVQLGSALTSSRKPSQMPTIPGTTHDSAWILCQWALSCFSMGPATAHREGR